MRNLQKILALALALIMSFSLVVTANAAFSDEADITDTYNEAVNVLSQLEVFKGYTDGTYQPQKSITRAEVAAIIYRIATGDVADTQVSIYSDWNRFTDVHSGEWWAGYINYCANAEYIKGYGNGKFGPDDPVTGYEALAMILRAVGYGKMDGEFQGSDWAVQTAARANSLKVTRNVQNTALLNSAATRELVAELLCQAILVPTVEYNQFSGYSENDESLAKRSFDMERLEGVVMANEYADLEDDDTLANGKTRLDVDGRDVTLNVTSDLTAIGESRYAYVRKTSNNDYDMVCSKLYDTGKNVINETGAAKDKVKDLVDAKSIKTVDETEYFINFDPDSSIWSSDWRIAYAIPKTALEANYTEYDKYLAGIQADKGTVRIDKLETEDGPVDAWYRWIAPDEDIPKEDQDIIQDIFYHADLKETDDTKLNQVVQGEVYVGTQSVEDVSDTLSFKQFQDRYIKTQLTKFEKTENGNWLKVVDNDNDGIVEYVFKTQCVLDEIVDSVTKDEKTTFYWRSLNTKDIDPAYMDGYEPEVGDVVVYAIIDGKAQMKLAETENATINAISYKDVTATSTEGTVYEQSDIDNETAMDELLVNMDEKVEYVLYKDHFGFIRAYKLAQGNKYALVTEVYPKYSFNSAYVKNTDLIAEVMTADDSSPKEHDVLNSKGNAFFVGSEKETWTHGSRYDKDNWLERAQAHLGLITSPLFDYDKKDTTTGANNYSYTNIARYTMTDDGVNLYTASQFAYDKDGKQWYWGTDEKGNDVKTKDKTDDPVYAVDYVQLAVKDIAKGQRSFDIDTSYENYGHSNGYVNAVNDTEYYLVMDGTIKHIVGRANLPALDVEDNGIRAMYAVAENTSADNVNQDYWVANVIVIELETTSTNYDSISLAFYNFYKRSGSTKYLNTLNNEYAGVELDVIPDEEDWPYQWNGYGFYGLRNTDDTDEAGTVEAELVPIGHQSVARSESYAKHRGYNENGIYAGIVTRVEKDYSRGDYIMANMVNYDGTTTRKELMVNNNQLFAIDEVKSGENEAVDIRIINGDNSELVAGDYIIWVNDSDGDCAFVINLTDKNTYKDHDWTTPDWLYDNDDAINSEWEYIVDSQGRKTESPEEPTDVTVKFYGVDANKNYTTGDGTSGNPYQVTVSYTAASNYAGAPIEVANGNYKVTDIKYANDNADASADGIKVNETRGKIYTVAVIGDENETLTYYKFTQSAKAVATNVTLSGTHTSDLVTENTRKIDITHCTGDSIITFLSHFTSTGDVTWTFVPKNSSIRSFQIQGVGNSADVSKIPDYINTMADIESVTAVVTRDGVSKLYSSATAGSVTVTNAAAFNENGTAADLTSLYPTETKTVYFQASGKGVFTLNGKEIESTYADGKTTTGLVTVKGGDEVVFTADAGSTTLPEAKTVNGKKTITLTEDLIANADLTIDGDVEVLDLGGKEINLPAGKTINFTANDNGDVSITIKNGTINAADAAISLGGTALSGDAFDLTIEEDATIDAGKIGVLVGSSAGAGEIVIKGTVIGGQYGISVNGKRTSAGSKGTEITVEDGAVIKGEGTGAALGMYLAGNCTTTILGGEISGESTGIEVRDGTLTINGGTITSSATKKTYAENPGNGPAVYGPALSVCPHDSRDVTVNINGGTIRGKVVDLEISDRTGSGGAVNVSVKYGVADGLNVVFDSTKYESDETGKLAVVYQNKTVSDDGNDSVGG